MLTKQQIHQIKRSAALRDLDFIDNMDGTVSIEECILDTLIDCKSFLKNIPIVKCLIT